MPGLFAEELLRATPAATIGPLYPDTLPLEQDNDLVLLSDSLTPAVGDITHLGGRILDQRGNPIRNATVEIWQVDSKATYLVERPGLAPASFDSHFQGFGRFETAANGAYRFRTIKPVAYPSRSAPHIHFLVRRPGRGAFATQLYIKGHPGNAQDGIYRALGTETAKQAVTVEFAPVPGSRTGDLAARFDIVLE